MCTRKSLDKKSLEAVGKRMPNFKAVLYLKRVWVGANPVSTIRSSAVMIHSIFKYTFFL